MTQIKQHARFASGFRIASISTLAMLAFMAGASRASAVTFLDTTFNASDYKTAFNYTLSGYSSTPSYSGGVDFAITTDGTGTAGANGVLTGVLNKTFVYDPTTQGAITSITASTFKSFTVTNNSSALITYGNNFRPLLEQDGFFYATGIAGAVLPVPGQSTASTVPATFVKLLTASDFTLIDPVSGTIGNPGTPNFSGDAITFGVVQLLGTGGPVTASTAYSNLSFNVVSGVPEASTWAMMMIGFAGLGYAAYRRTKVGNADSVATV